MEIAYLVTFRVKFTENTEWAYQYPEKRFFKISNVSNFSPVITEKWKSVEKLEFHTKNRDENKYPAWNRFTQKINRDIQVEIWHEIFQVNEGQFTRVYNGLPVYGTTRMIQIIPFMAIREKAIWLYILKNKVLFC